MGKRCRQLVVVSSSDEEDGNNKEHLSKSSFCGSKSGAYGAHKKLKDGSQHSDSSIQLQKANILETKDWSFLVPEMFSESLVLQQPVVPKNRNQRQGSTQSAAIDLWVDKYKPRMLTELAVHRKKVAEVQAWLEMQESSRSRVLLLTGPSGVGKTATVRVITDLLGIKLCEWETPTPTLWREYIHHVNSGTSYISKLDEFEAFIGAIRKYPILPMDLSNATGRSRKSVVFLIDDLPVANSREACQQLCQCLQTLALSAQFPTIISITEFTEAGDREGPSRMIQEFQLALEKGGATKIVFNPLTSKTITKALTKIWTAECHSEPPEWLSFISESSGGDIRHAITSLQFCCLSHVSSTWDSGGFSGPPKAKSRKLTQKKVARASMSSFSCIDYMDKKLMSCMGRDGILSLFHALGKFLHNKRCTDQVADSGHGSLILSDKFVRYPLKIEVPELVLSQAHAEAGTFAAFLHENVLDFISNEAIDDAWMALSYLSDSDCLLGASSSRCLRRPQALLDGDDFDSQRIAEAVAGSVVTRGVLFSNVHPAPPRWQAIRGPTLWQVERSSHQRRWLAPPVHRVHLESSRYYKQQWDYEETETTENESTELDDFLRFSDEDILPISNTNISFNSNINENTGEMAEDEIEEW